MGAAGSDDIPGIALQPNRWSFNPSPTGFSAYVWGGADESYDAADFQNVHLAVMIPNPNLGEVIDKKSGLQDSRAEIPFVEAKPIMQPFGDRSKVVIEPMLTDQWFVDSAKIVERTGVHHTNMLMMEETRDFIKSQLQSE